jgi:hypothetical protein
MIPRRFVLAGGALLAARPAWAIDPGVATGGYRGDEGAIDVTRSVALAVDNAEGFGDFNRGLRVVLSDVEVLPSALTGIAFPPVRGLARDGKLRGILLEFDPADRKTLFATVLAKPEPGYSLGTTTLSDSEGLWTRLDASATRVSGELKPEVSDHFRFSFSAPVFTNAVTADLSGPAAAASPPVKALIARAEAFNRGDMAAVQALSTPTAAAQMQNLPPEMLKLAKREMPGLMAKLKTPKRVVIRRETAAVMLEKGSWASVALVDGVWKAAD